MYALRGSVGRQGSEYFEICCGGGWGEAGLREGVCEHMTSLRV